MRSGDARQAGLDPKASDRFEQAMTALSSSMGYLLLSTLLFSLEFLCIQSVLFHRTIQSVIQCDLIYSMCERILRAPTPLVYTRHTSRFLLAWCLLLPLGLYTVLVNYMILCMYNMHYILLRTCSFLLPLLPFGRCCLLYTGFSLLTSLNPRVEYVYGETG